MVHGGQKWSSGFCWPGDFIASCAGAVDTHSGLVESLHFSLALLGNLLIAALNTFDDALHVQVAAVVHLHDDRGVTELTIQLSSLLQDPSQVSDPAKGGVGLERKCMAGEGCPMNAQHGVLQMAGWFPARAGSWDLLLAQYGIAAGNSPRRVGSPGGATRLDAAWCCRLCQQFCGLCIPRGECFGHCRLPGSVWLEKVESKHGVPCVFC